MGFRHIDTILQGRGLRAPLLNILNQDSGLYNALLFQPVDSLEYGSDFIRNSERDRANTKFRTFFQLASEKHAELAVTPEYSCPWRILEEVIQDIDSLAEDQIRVIGCESIKANELNIIIGGNAQVTWVYEEDKVIANLENDRFFDPVCYFFKTKTQESNEIRAVVIVQFKTHHFGGKGMEWERDNFIPGEVIYVIKNRTASTRLVTFICSDSLNVQQDLNISALPDFENHPYLILHIQLNQSPNNLDYSRYRSETYRMGWGNKEFICLNWGRNVIIDNQLWNRYGGSAMYIQSLGDDEKKFDTCDNRLNANHSKGMYYTRWEKRKAHLYCFNYDEHVFLLRSTKVSQLSALPATRARTGPELREIYIWNGEENYWIPDESVNHGFNDLCDELHQTGSLETIRDIGMERPIDAERLISLSVGKALDKDWHLPTKNPFFKIEDNEIDNRITFIQNPTPEIRQSKKDYLGYFSTLEYIIIHNENNFPDSIEDLKNNCEISYRPEGYKEEYCLNLFPSNTTGAPASGVFLGLTQKEFAQSVRIKMMELFEGNQYAKRVVIW